MLAPDAGAFDICVFALSIFIYVHYDQLFSRINSNSLHILQQFMPDRPSLNYSLRARPHNKTLIAKTAQLNDQDFVIRSIYKDLY